jgi:hypothetical protein
MVRSNSRQRHSSQRGSGGKGENVSRRGAETQSKIKTKHCECRDAATSPAAALVLHMGEEGALASALNVHSPGRTPKALARGLGIAERCVVPTISVGHECRGSAGCARGADLSKFGEVMMLVLALCRRAAVRYILRDLRTRGKNRMALAKPRQDRKAGIEEPRGTLLFLLCASAPLREYSGRLLPLP